MGWVCLLVCLFVCEFVMSRNFVWRTFLVTDLVLVNEERGEANSMPILSFVQFPRLQTRTVNAFDDDPTLSRFLPINSPARNASVRSLISSS